MKPSSILPTDFLSNHNAQIETKDLTPLAASVDYNLRIVIQEALKFARHSKRTRLNPSDINKSLRILNAPPSYVGPSSRDPLAVPLARAAREANYLDDDDQDNQFDASLFTSNRRVALQDLKLVDLPRIPLEPALTASWIAVDGHATGVPTTTNASKKKRKRTSGSTGSNDVIVDPGVYHSLSHQQRKLLADLLSKATPSTEEEQQNQSEGIDQQQEQDEEDVQKKIELQMKRRNALRVMSSSIGLQPLLPYFIHHISSTINSNLKQLNVLKCMLHMTSALLVNSNVDLELYLDQILPCIFSCLVGKRICSNPMEDHWSTRDCAAVVLASVVERYGKKYPDLSGRIMNTLCCAIWRDKRPKTTEYGSIVGLTALGSQTIEHLVLPRAAEYLNKLTELEKKLSKTKKSSSSSSSSGSGGGKNDIKLLEIRKCRFAMYHATHVFSRSTGGSNKTASEELIKILTDLEKTHSLSSSANPINPIVALREAAGEALLPFTMSTRTDVVNTFL